MIRRTAPATHATPVTHATSAAPPIDITRIIRYAPTRLIGREAETALLVGAWQQAVADTAARVRVLGFVALGGEGKTALVAKWLSQMAQQAWSGCTPYPWQSPADDIQQSRRLIELHGYLRRMPFL